MGSDVEREGCCRLVLLVTVVGAVMASLGVCGAVVFGYLKGACLDDQHDPESLQLFALGISAGFICWTGGHTGGGACVCFRRVASVTASVTGVVHFVACVLLTIGCCQGVVVAGGGAVMRWLLRWGNLVAGPEGSRCKPRACRCPSRASMYVAYVER